MATRNFLGRVSDTKLPERVALRVMPRGAAGSRVLQRSARLSTTRQEEAFAGDFNDFEAHVVGVVESRYRLHPEDFRQMISQKVRLLLADE